MNAGSSNTARSLRRHTIAGATTLVLLVGGLGGWAATSEFAGAVVASGTVVVDSSVKKVQHPTGGVVGELLVRDGSHVQAGDVVVRLDETITRANLTVVEKALDELTARGARLEAERDNLDAVVFPDALAARRSEVDAGRILAGEERLFALRRSARQGQKAQLAERVGQLKEQLQGLAGQESAKAREGELIRKELAGVRELWQKNLVQISRVMSLEREAVQLDGQRHQLVASQAEVKGKITEVELQSLQIDEDLRSEVAKELREIQAKIAESVERKIAAEDQLKRIDIRAPLSGTVHQLAVHTVGGVVGAGEQLMLIVPDADVLTIEAKIPPQSIDQVSMGQNARIRFSAFNQRTTPEIDGTVTRVAADVTQDPQSGVTYYIARIAMPDAEIARLGGLKLLPGIPVEAFIRTDMRSVLSYLIEPLREQVARSFRER